MIQTHSTPHWKYSWIFGATRDIRSSGERISTARNGGAVAKRAANLVRSAPNRCIRHSKARFARADAQFDSHLTAIMFGLQTQQFKHPALNPGMKWFTPIALHNLAVDVLAVRSIETAAQLLLC